MKRQAVGRPLREVRRYELVWYRCRASSVVIWANKESNIGGWEHIMRSNVEGDGRVEEVELQGRGVDVESADAGSGDGGRSPFDMLGTGARQGQAHVEASEALWSRDVGYERSRRGYSTLRWIDPRGGQVQAIRQSGIWYNGPNRRQRSGR